MTLRLRLVLALVVLTAVGLAVFGVTTYSLYARSEYRRVDDTLRSTAPFVPGDLYSQAFNGFRPPDNDDNNNGNNRGGPPALVPPGTYAELRTTNGKVITSSHFGSTSTSRPKLGAHLTVGALQTVGSAQGTGRWRVLVSSAGARTPASGDLVVVAVPLSSVDSSLHHLVLIESIAALALLILLGLGAWFVLRRGLQSLETMATSAAAISEGDLSLRVAPSDRRTEVGQLGLALNTMLDEIEMSFHEREATEQRLRQFLADASHELRTPLTSIQGFAELFRLDTTTEHVDMPVIMRRIEEESARMSILVEDLLLLARVDRTRTPERQPVDLAVIAADACSDAVATAPDRAVTLTAPLPALVEGDADHLRQAVANLVVNALRHTPAGSPIDIEASATGDTARIVVRDHGAGLDDDALAHAFDRFWQADTARAGAGVGLGLAIVTAIAEEHDGRVEAENAPDGGARFTLTLPRAR
jgi:two-component system OmpR family sensor kinase